VNSDEAVPAARISAIWCGLALALATIAAYVGLHDAGFVWDDDAFVTQNPLIHAPDGLFRFWFTREPPDYFPLTSTVLWFEWRAFGTAAFGYHLVNVLLHAGSAVLLWRVLLRLRVGGAWIAALLFGLHPVAVESVAWITELKNALPMTLGLAALLIWLRWRDSGGAAPFWLANVLFLAALLAKTSVVALPLVVILLMWWRNARVTGRDVRGVAPWLLLSLVLGLVTMSYQSGVAIGDEVVRGDGLLSRVAIAGQALWFYLFGALAPVGTCFVHPRWSLAAPGVLDFVPLAAWIGLLLVTFRGRSPLSRGAFVALASYTLLLAPVLGLVDIYFMKFSLVADHWQYPGLPVICAVLGSLAVRVRAPHIRAGIVATTALCFAALTFRATVPYASERALFEATVRCNPSAWLAHFRLGALAADRGRLDRAERHLRAALEQYPDYALGRVLTRSKDWSAAEEQFQRVLGLPGSQPAPVLGELANLHLAQGALTKADAHFRRSIEADPARANVRNNYASCLVARKQYGEALGQLDEALRLDPTLQAAQVNRGRVLALMGGRGE